MSAGTCVAGVCLAGHCPRVKVGLCWLGERLLDAVLVQQGTIV